MRYWLIEQLCLSHSLSSSMNKYTFSPNISRFLGNLLQRIPYNHFTIFTQWYMLQIYRKCHVSHQLSNTPLHRIMKCYLFAYFIIRYKIKGNREIRQPKKSMSFVHNERDIISQRTINILSCNVHISVAIFSSSYSWNIEIQKQYFD